MGLLQRTYRLGEHRRSRGLGHWTITVALVVGCTATDAPTVAQDCATVASQTTDPSYLPLAMPEDLLDLGTGGGVYCNDGPDGSRLMWLYSPVTSEDRQTFWIVANPELVTEQEVDRFFNGQTENDLTIELVDTSQEADYYLASTDIKAALSAVQTSTDTLSVSDYSALSSALVESSASTRSTPPTEQLPESNAKGTAKMSLSLSTASR